MRAPAARRAAALAALGVLAALAGALGSLGCTGERRPNVILLSIDTLRPDHLGAYGYGRATSPHIDALARESLVFEQAVAHASSTLASHASLLTSLLPQHHGASVGRGTALPEDVSTLAEVLREHGYATASFNGGVQLHAVYGLAQGFDVYESVRLGDTVAHALRDPEDRLAHTVARALGWLAATPERPFFLFLHSYEVHHPYTPQDAFWVPTHARYAGPVPREVPVALLEAAIAGRVTFDAEDRQRIVDAYDAEIRSADAAVGELVAALRRGGLLDETLLVLTSDHGEEFGERGWVGWHGHTLFDELLRVPLLMRLPGGYGGGRRIPHQVRGIDVAPTVLDLLGIERPAAFEGRSLVREDGGADARPSVSRKDSASEHVVSLRAGAWKLTRGSVYHLAADRGETTDLAATEPVRGEQLAATLRKLLLQRPLQPGTPVTPDRALVERLRALGYAGGDGRPGPPRTPGLLGTYWPNAGWQGEPALRRMDGALDFDGQAAPWPLEPPFSVEWTGEIEIERGGLHAFQLASDDGATLEIGDALVVDNGGPHPLRTRHGRVELAPGRHRIRVRYFNALLAGVIRLAWEPVGGPLAPVPAGVLTCPCDPPSPTSRP